MAQVSAFSTKKGSTGPFNPVFRKTSQARKQTKAPSSIFDSSPVESVPKRAG
jgi:hypothetical protein